MNIRRPKGAALLELILLSILFLLSGCETVRTNSGDSSNVPVQYPAKFSH
ncbi:MAG TPA: hypothetical protein VL404_06735 [Candidatus Eisenbacteria bacterium]|nr:hypothetical protein [Candidatus Eisenbacteria bacterium]